MFNDISLSLIGLLKKLDKISMCFGILAHCKTQNFWFCVIIKTTNSALQWIPHPCEAVELSMTLPEGIWVNTVMHKCAVSFIRRWPSVSMLCEGHCGYDNILRHYFSVFKGAGSCWTARRTDKMIDSQRVLASFLQVPWIIFLLVTESLSLFSLAA